MHIRNQGFFLSSYPRTINLTKQPVAGWSLCGLVQSIPQGTKIIQNWGKNMKNARPSYQGDLFEGKPEKDMVF
jgi:hypothetical protein